MDISRFTAWSMWLTVSFFYGYQYILRVMPNILMADIIERYKISASAFGQFSGLYYIGYAMMHIPLGIMFDRYGLKRVVPVCMLMTSIGLLPLIFTDILLYPLVGRMLIGMGSSAAILGIFKVIIFAFGTEKFTHMFSLSTIIGLAGAIYGGGPVSYMCKIMGYQFVVGFFAFIGACLAILTYFIMPHIPAHTTTSAFSDIRDVLLTKKVIIICLCSGLFVGTIEGFADVWASTFLKLRYGLSEGLAASLPAVIFLGMCFGGPFLSFIAKKTKNYIGTIIAAGFTIMIGFTILVSGLMPNYYVPIIFGFIGVASAYKILALYKTTTYLDDRLASLAAAVVNMVVMFFGYLFHTSIGLVVNAMGGAKNPQALAWGVAVIPIAASIGLIGFIFVGFHDYITQKNAL